jgi:hypothetical protein
MNEERRKVVSSNYEYYVDLVLAIDATGSMRPVIDGVKAFTANMHDQVQGAMQAIGKRIDGLRVKVIVFRDFAHDAPADALGVLDFKKVPDESSAISDFVNQIRAKGGGDAPENGLDALALAINSDWIQEGTKQRHIIILFSDAPPHDYMTRTGSVQLPALPATLDDLIDQWTLSSQTYETGLKKGSRRLFLFVPDDAKWNVWEGQELVALADINTVNVDPEGTRTEIIRLIQESVAA